MDDELIEKRSTRVLKTYSSIFTPGPVNVSLIEVSPDSLEIETNVFNNSRLIDAFIDTDSITHESAERVASRMS
jgi:hypothetical protein